jgi:hypothetical protein
MTPPEPHVEQSFDRLTVSDNTLTADPTNQINPVPKSPARTELPFSLHLLRDKATYVLIGPLDRRSKRTAESGMR